MKINKKQAGLIAGVVCVILLILLLLTMCNGSGGSGDQNEPTQSAETIGETTEATEETTEATEETTEPVEETTEATEETTGSNTSGNTTRPGSNGPALGSGSTGSGSDDDDDSSTQETTPAAGSESSPYVEVVESFPDSVSSVAIPGEGQMYYNLTLNDANIDIYGESLLTIEAEDVYVIYNETKYEPQEGLVSVPIAAVEEEDTPVSIQICNTGKEAKSFALSFNAPLGTAFNPEPIVWDEDGSFALSTDLEAENMEGYLYSFLAARNGFMELQLDSVTEGVDCGVTVTVGTKSATLSSEEAMTFEFNAGDLVVVHVYANAVEDGTYPAAKVELSGSVDYYGSKTSPIEVTADFVTEEIEPGSEVYYLVTGQNGMALSVEYPAYVIYNGVTYQAEPSEDSDETAVVSVKIGNTDTEALIAIGNGGEEAQSFTMVFGYPAGNVNNKAPLVVENADDAEVGTNVAVIDDGDTDVYWYTWTNEEDAGILTIHMPDEGNWKYMVKHTSNGNTTEYDMQYSDSESAQSTFNLLMAYNDVLELQVAAYDPAEPEAYPEGSVEFQASFLAHVQTNASGYTWLTLDGGGMIYCKQGLKYADGAIMTVVAVEADEDGNAVLDENGNVTVLTDSAFTIDYEGTVYTSENGTIVIEGIEMESSDPDIFSVLNDGNEKATYRISFAYPAGHQTNPIPLNSGDVTTVTLYGDGGSGTYYSWTTSEAGYFVFEIDTDAIWSYNISSTRDTTVTSSTYNGVNTDYVSYLALYVGQGHINSSKDGTVTFTINLGNPSTDSENRSVVTFKVNSYKTEVTKEASVKVAAGQTLRLMQNLEDTAANGMVITGTDSFTVVYNGTEYVSENGAVKIANFTTDRSFFQIINNSAEEQTYSISFSYPEGSQKNPKALEVGEISVDLYTVGDGYYYSWTAPSDGTFHLEIPATDGNQYKPWSYEITHGEDVYLKRGSANRTFSLDVQEGDVLIVKFGVTRTLTISTVVPVTIGFTEAVAETNLLSDNETVSVAYESDYVPTAFDLVLNADEELAYTDLTQKYALYLNAENGCYYLAENGPMILVDFSSDTFVNLKKLLETSELYCEITAEDGSVTRESYNALLQKYIACAKVIAVSEDESRTLYPLTEDLMYILKNVGSQLGWYDSASGGYLFGEVAGIEADSAWMFSCCYVRTVETQTAEAPVTETAEETPEETSAE